MMDLKPKEFVALLHDTLKGCGSDITVEVKQEDEICSETGSYSSGTIIFSSCGEPFLKLKTQGTDQTCEKPRMWDPR
jgi:hypothetical protein